ncbi:unnamed protein product [Sphagnum troendelagicum]|uniref:Uncharacterized protein n=1 Tax=Sphagnum troendelagicum TaxID=128251 RepID=A0ABP0T9Y0_9BRYO
MAEVRPVKKARVHEGDHGAEEGLGLVKLVDRRRVDVEKLVTHIAHLEKELKEAQVKLSEAESLLQQIRKRSPPKKDKCEEKLAFRGVTTKFPLESNSTVPKESNGAVAKSTWTSSHSSPLKKTWVADEGRTSASVRFNKTERSIASSSHGVAEQHSKLPASSQTYSGRIQDMKPSDKLSGQKKFKVVVPQREHMDLIVNIRSQKKAKKLDVGLPSYIPIQHKRKPRSLVLSPATDHLCATSALDGVVNFWQIKEKGLGLNLSHTVDCISPITRRWPEDLAWHPMGNALFAVYHADGGPQVSIINASKQKPEVQFLNDKPHEKGIINSIQFMPWSNGTQFATAGCDHGVVLWSEKEGSDRCWQPHLLHRVLHSSSVSGVAGIPHKQLVLSSGLDKRLFAVDLAHGKSAFQHTLESKALGVLSNPADFNLFMAQTGTPGQQLRLFDIRVHRTELHAFGWKQEAGDSQSGYISQSWSPDGLYCASGSTDPKIHVFDIRYNSSEPAQTLDAHQKRVFKAAWHPNLPLLLSISSDLFIGLHRIFE